jgi:hypothetical protein
MIRYTQTSLQVNAVLPNNLKVQTKIYSHAKRLYFKIFVLTLQLKCVLNWCVLTSALADFTLQSAFSFMPLMSVLHLTGYKLGRHSPEICDSTNPATSQSLPVINVSITLSTHRSVEELPVWEKYIVWCIRNGFFLMLLVTLWQGLCYLEVVAVIKNAMIVVRHSLICMHCMVVKIYWKCT